MIQKGQCSIDKAEHSFRGQTVHISLTFLFQLLSPALHQLDPPKTVEAAVFSLFPSLPTELWIQIWRDGLPEKVGQALYFYKKGCWHPRYLTEADASYNPHDDELNLVFEFRHELLDDIQLVIPSFFVNHEARRITLAWIQRQGIKIRFYKEKQCLTFTRSFNPKYDTLYVPLEKWDEFFIEPFD